jgi:hypothetical protein
LEQNHHELIGLRLQSQQGLLKFFIRLTMHLSHLLDEHFADVVQAGRHTLVWPSRSRLYPGGRTDKD